MYNIFRPSNSSFLFFSYLGQLAHFYYCAKKCLILSSYKSTYYLVRVLEYTNVLFHCFWF